MQQPQGNALQTLLAMLFSGAMNPTGMGTQAPQAPLGPNPFVGPQFNPQDPNAQESPQSLLAPFFQSGLSQTSQGGNAGQGGGGLGQMLQSLLGQLGGSGGASGGGQQQQAQGGGGMPNEMQMLQNLGWQAGPSSFFGGQQGQTQMDLSKWLFSPQGMFNNTQMAPQPFTPQAFNTQSGQFGTAPGAPQMGGREVGNK